MPRPNFITQEMIDNYNCSWASSPGPETERALRLFYSGDVLDEKVRQTREGYYASVWVCDTLSAINYPLQAIEKISMHIGNWVANGKDPWELAQRYVSAVKESCSASTHLACQN